MAQGAVGGRPRVDRVAMVTQAIYPDLVGGSPIACHELANALVRRGTQVEIDSVAYPRPAEGAPASPPLYRLRRHRKVPLPWDLIGTAGNPWAPGILRAVRRSPAPVVHVQSHLFWSSVLGARAARQSGKAVVVAVHGVRAVRGPVVNLLQEVWLRTLARRLLASADLVVCLSRRDAAEVERYGARPARIRIVPNGCSGEDFHPGAEPPLDQVAWVGRHVPEKGVRFLIEAWRRVRIRFPSTRLVLVGDGPLRRDAERQAAEAGLAEGVSFIPFQPRGAVGELLRRSRLFVLPSLQEGFPLALAEAMTCGVPCVTTSGLEEVVGEGGLTVPAGRPAELAAAIEELLADPGRARAMGEAGARRARQQFTWDAVAARMEACYQEAVEERQKRGRPSSA